jgi:hypothetical protein
MGSSDESSKLIFSVRNERSTSAAEMGKLGVGRGQRLDERKLRNWKTCHFMQQWSHQGLVSHAERQISARRSKRWKLKRRVKVLEEVVRGEVVDRREWLEVSYTA